MRSIIIVLLLVCQLPMQLIASDALYDKDRAQQLYGMFRCVVCDGQSLMESDAAIAIDMRNFIVSQIKAGETDEQIISTLVASYGETILMAPPVTGEHIIIWLLPIFLLIGGGILLFRSLGLKGE